MHFIIVMDLSKPEKKNTRQLSGGMKRRVGLIQALLNNPDFLIIDEPTTGLDPEERIRIRNLLVDFSKDRTCLLYTSSNSTGSATTNSLASRLSLVFSVSSTAFQSCSRSFHSDGAIGGSITS